VVRARPICVTSVDTSVEGVHFRLGDGWMSARDVGWRSLAVALSDLAAMGAEPGEAYIALGLPQGLPEQEALELMRGAQELAEQCGTVIAGGDVVRAPALMVSVTVVGWSDSPDDLASRAGAVPGDLIAVTGRLGGAGAALAVLEAGADTVSGLAGSAPLRAALGRLRRPFPRLSEGAALAGEGVRAMIDLSDGLATDAVHLGMASGVRLRIELESLPLEPGLAELAGACSLDPLALAASAGEDYELCLCVSPPEREAVERRLAQVSDTALAWVGEVHAGQPGATFIGARGEERELRGFEHHW